MRRVRGQVPPSSSAGSFGLVPIQLILDDLDDLKRVTAQSEDVRLERVAADHWYLRVGGHDGETLVVHLQTVPASPEIRAFYSKDSPRR